MNDTAVITREAMLIEKLFEKGASIDTVIERPDGGREVLIPTGFKPHTLPPLEPPLPRIRQVATFYDRVSFTAYVNRFKLPDAQLFAMPGHLAKTPACVTAVLDHHKGNADGAGPAPDRCAHIAQYLPPYAEEWVRWGKPLAFSQVEFAEFIEENRKDVREPAANTLFDLVRNFKASKKVEFDSTAYQPDGSLKLLYVNEVKPAMTVPEKLTLAIPVFFKGTVYEVPVFLRYAVDGGRVHFALKPDRPEYIEQAAFDEILAAIAAETAIAPYIGKRA